MKNAILVLLFFAVTVAFGAAVADPDEIPGHAASINEDELKFVTFPGFPTCTTGAIVHGDPNQGPVSVLQKIPPDCRIPWHWHTANEQIVLISGTMEMMHKDSKPMLLRPGGYYFNPGHHVHSVGCPKGCTIFVTVDGKIDIHWVDNAGKEISLDEALAKESGKR